MPVSTDDYVAISDHLGRYCFAVDGGDEDGVFTGIRPEAIVGREALKDVPRDEWKQAGGKMRHLIGNLHCDYQGDQNTVLAQYYNFVSSYMDGGRFTCMAICKVLLVRAGKGWLIKRNDTVVYPG
jgi:hypothetical protein